MASRPTTPSAIPPWEVNNTSSMSQARFTFPPCRAMLPLCCWVVANPPPVVGVAISSEFANPA